MSELLQEGQFRVARTEDYDKHQKHNGAAKDKDDKDDEVREVAAHKNVFHRP